MPSISLTRRIGTPHFRAGTVSAAVEGELWCSTFEKGELDGYA